MKVKDQEAWDKLVETAGKKLFGREIILYALRWAHLMENAMEHSPLEEIAKKTSFEADTEIISNSMYGKAVEILVQHWEHGEILRQWHNLETQIGTEGEEANKKGGVLNPSIIVFGKS